VIFQHCWYADNIRIALDGKTLLGRKIVCWRAGYHKQRTSPTMLMMFVLHLMVRLFWGRKIICQRAGYHEQKTSPDERAPLKAPWIDGFVRGEKRVFEMWRETRAGEEHAVSGEDDKLGGSCQTGGGR